MSKKQILILVLTFVLILGGILVACLVVPNMLEEKLLEEKILEEKLKVGEYSLKYGIYEGIEKEYDPDLDKFYENKKILTLIDNETYKMNGEEYKFTIKENKIYVDGYENFEITEDDKITYLVGGGIDYEWKRYRNE